MMHGGNYALAEKMKDRFGSRGSSVSGMQASTTSELMRRAEREHNPNGNAAEQAFRENYLRHRGTAYQAPANPSGTAGTSRRTSSEDTVRHRSGTVRQTDASRHKQRPLKQKPAPQPTIVRPEPIAPAAETRAEKKPFPLILLAILLAAALIIMGLVTSISTVYQTRQKIANLERELAGLEETAEQLELRLEEKNDMKNIEALATGRLGMVKEEYVQKEYISLSDGERIELIDSGEEETAGGVMLSSVFSALGDFFERFK